MADHNDTDPLAACIETVQRLEEENDQLRKAAGAFGQLAERLNQSLQQERRTGTDRRDGSRATNDRRASSH
ncbi:MAG: hypothetical protein V7647_137 [Acidobacteriota bacterium]|jgi:hypothetical protein